MIVVQCHCHVDIVVQIWPIPTNYSTLHETVYFDNLTKFNTLRHKDQNVHLPYLCDVYNEIGREIAGVVFDDQIFVMLKQLHFGLILP